MKYWVSLVLILTSPLAVLAAEVPESVRRAAATLVPSAEADEIAPSPVPGLYQAVFGAYVFYISADGKHLVRGDVLDLETRANLTAPVRNRARAQVIDSLGEKNMIVFGAATPKHVVTVFTDVDCGYCAKLHREMEQYLAQGITVRYVAFPRAGIGSDSYDKMVSVWCADDQRKSMTDAKARRPVQEKTCDNPVAEQFETGRLLGVRGTPTIVMETGEIVPGYVPAKELAKALEDSKAGNG